MRRKIKIFISICICIMVLMAGISIGSVPIAPADIFIILWSKLIGRAIPAEINDITVSLVWKLRLPRVLLAFIVGGALSASGAVMQSVLKNPLASSYTLGVSSGAALGVGIVIISGFSIPLLGTFTLPVVGLVSGLLTVFLAVTFAAKVDRNMENNTIILAGMVFSLFINAILTIVSAMSKGYMERIIFWQMGSFSSKDWICVIILASIVAVGIPCIMRFSRELDIMTFGEEQAQAIGVELKKVKWLMLALSSALTGSAVAFAGIIGFVDLITPHVARKLFGSSHRYVVPLSALFGGAFMVAADLVARTVISPSELPVGAVTAIIGAPFFGYIYFKRRKK